MSVAPLTGAEVAVLNIGALSDRDPDALLMGRVVPISTGPGRMFESRPLEIDPETAAEAVELLRESATLGWVLALKEGRDAHRLVRGLSCTDLTFYTSDLPIRTDDVHLDPAPATQELIDRGYSPDIANALGVLEAGLIAAAVSPDSVFAVGPHVAAALAEGCVAA